MFWGKTVLTRPDVQPLGSLLPLFSNVDAYSQTPRFVLRWLKSGSFRNDTCNQTSPSWHHVFTIDAFSGTVKQNKLGKAIKLCNCLPSSCLILLLALHCVTDSMVKHWFSRKRDHSFCVNTAPSAVSVPAKCKLLDVSRVPIQILRRRTQKENSTMLWTWRVGSALMLWSLVNLVVEGAVNVSSFLLNQKNVCFKDSKIWCEIYLALFWCCVKIFRLCRWLCFAARMFFCIHVFLFCFLVAVEGLWNGANRSLSHWGWRERTAENCERERMRFSVSIHVTEVPLRKYSSRTDKEIGKTTP